MTDYTQMIKDTVEKNKVADLLTHHKDKHFFTDVIDKI